MSTNFIQDPKYHTRPPPPYTVDPTGSAYLSNTGTTTRAYSENSTRANNGIKDDRKFLTLLQTGSIIVLMLCSLSCIVALHRNTKIMEQNLKLLEQQLGMLEKSKPGNVIINNERIRRMVNPLDSCPPCTTETPPNPIEPHRNPVSVLNEEVGKLATYVVAWECEDPHIHHATLKIINDPSFEGKIWNGKGRNMQSAKQAAAWEAIQKDLPYLKELVAEEYIPPPTMPRASGPMNYYITGMHKII